MSELRCYHFGNFYMSSIQQGIQAAHAQMEMFTKYKEFESEPSDILFSWGNDHKTMICLNGGDDESLHMILDHVSKDDHELPWSSFNESKSAMAGMLTNVAIVLPDYIFNTASWLRNKRNKLDCPHYGGPHYVPPGADISDYANIEFTQWEVDFMYILNKCGLAR